MTRTHTAARPGPENNGAVVREEGWWQLETLGTALTTGSFTIQSCRLAFLCRTKLRLRNWPFHGLHGCLHDVEKEHGARV